MRKRKLFKSNLLFFSLICFVKKQTFSKKVGQPKIGDTTLVDFKQGCQIHKSKKNLMTGHSQTLQNPANVVSQL